MLYFILIWLLLGLVASIFIINYELKQGRDFLLGDLLMVFVIILFGPISLLVYLLCTFQVNADKVLIKGRKK